MSNLVCDDSFKRMAPDLSYTRGSVKEVADELDINMGRLNRWRQKITGKGGVRHQVT